MVVTTSAIITPLVTLSTLTVPQSSIQRATRTRISGSCCQPSQRSSRFVSGSLVSGGSISGVLMPSGRLPGLVGAESVIVTTREYDADIRARTLQVLARTVAV